MDIEVGSFVRTNDGHLGKLIAINKQDYNYLVVDTTREVRKDEYPATYLYLKNENIKNHSKNIIDLIEEGDYVNGKLIHKIDKGKNYCYLYYGNCKTFVDYQIKSIVTKEQYKSAEYVF